MCSFCVAVQDRYNYIGALGFKSFFIFMKFTHHLKAKDILWIWERLVGGYGYRQ